MLKVCLTGNIATGKSSVEKIFNCKFGVPVIDADKITHDLLEYDVEIRNKIKKAFEGFDILKSCGSLSRSKIASIVFSDKEKRTQLEQILHPKIRLKIQEFFEENNDKDVAIASVALLFEANWQEDFDKIILVSCDKDTQLERLMERASIHKDDALKRINAQMPQEEKTKMADYIIENNFSLGDLESNTKIVYDNMMSKN